MFIRVTRHQNVSQPRVPSVPQNYLLTVHDIVDPESDNLESDTLDADDDHIPTTPNEVQGSDNESESSSSCVEILDGGGMTGIDMGRDIRVREETKLTKFSRTLCELQKKALEEEKAKGNKRKTYTGRSHRTASRQKRFQSNLAAQGYLPVHEFMKQMDLRNGGADTSCLSSPLISSTAN